MSAPEIDLDTLADLIVERLVDRLGGLPATGELVDAAEVARRFGVSRGWVYEHAEQLGVVELGSGPRARKRFDLERVAAALSGCDERNGSMVTDPPRRRRKPKTRPGTTPNGSPLLPVAGSEG